MVSAIAAQLEAAQRLERSQSSGEVAHVSEFPRRHAFTAKFVVCSRDPAKNRLLSSGRGLHDRFVDRSGAVTATKVWNEEDEAALVYQVTAPDREAVLAEMLRICGGAIDLEHPVRDDGSGTDVVDVLVQGPSENRIDFVFLGDGYTTDQRNLFIEDATRMTQEMFQVPGTSLHSILPMVNVRAIFVPSSQSGIQTSDSNTTAFGLTRFGSQYRGMYTLNKESARRALSGLGDPINVNYPMIIGNDPYYGGLEGELTTSTASKTSGVIVLRHELGHNLMDVGEEYDNSDNYFGTNTSSNANEVPWAHWITDPSMKEEKSAILLMDYAWYDLSQGPYTLNFTASGDYARYMMRFSLSGCNEDGAIKISVDGEELPNWTSKATLDRFFYDEGRDNGFKAGAHTIVFSEAGPRPEGAPIRQLCSVQVIEFGDKDEFHNDAEYVGRFPTYGIDGVYYRPSGETCIMRCMVSNVFCRVCKETLLLNLLRRVSLIDNITAKHDNGFGSVQVSLLPFAQFRAPGMEVAGERYEVSWIVGGVERVDLKGILKLTDAAIEEGVEWWVVVKLVTPEIRKDDFEYTTSRAKIIWA